MLSLFRQRLLWCLALAVLNSSGGHIALLQSVAWSGMLWRNAQASSVLQAVKSTFDGKHPCGRCHELASAQSKQASLPEKALEQRLDPFVVSMPASRLELAAPAARKWPRVIYAYRSLKFSPPTPPPRPSFLA